MLKRTSRIDARKFSPKSLLELVRPTSLTFPYHQNPPAQLTQLGFFFYITLYVGIELGEPELLPGSERAGAPTAWAPAPETTMHKYDSAILGEDDVRRARQGLSVQTKAKALTMQQGANK